MSAAIILSLGVLITRLGKFVVEIEIILFRKELACLRFQFDWVSNCCCSESLPLQRYVRYAGFDLYLPRARIDLVSEVDYYSEGMASALTWS